MRARAAKCLVTAALCAGAVGAAGAQSQGEMPVDARKMIVRVVSSFASRPVEPGSGILVGATPDSLYIVTAWHVVATTRDTATDIRVAFYPCDSTTAPAVVRHLGSSTFDVAVIAVARDSAGDFARHVPALDRLSDGRRLRFGDAVRPAGCPNGACWAMLSDPDRVVGLDRRGVTIQSDAVKPGSSGGGLFDAWWELVGLVTELDPPRAEAILMDRVVAQLVSWNVPRQLRRPAIPRAGYRTTLGVSVFTSTPVGFTRLPAGRATLMLRGSSRLAWHAGVSRFAPDNLGINAAVGGIDLLVRPSRWQRLTIHPFFELGVASTEGRYDISGYYVVTPNGPVYVPVWKQVKGGGMGEGVGLGIEYIVLPGIIGEVTVGRWTFPTPSPLASFGKTQIAIGVRRGR